MTEIRIREAFNNELQMHTIFTFVFWYKNEEISSTALWCSLSSNPSHLSITQNSHKHELNPFPSILHTPQLLQFIPHPQAPPSLLAYSSSISSSYKRSAASCSASVLSLAGGFWRCVVEEVLSTETGSMFCTAVEPDCEIEDGILNYNVSYMLWLMLETKDVKDDRWFCTLRCGEPRRSHAKFATRRILEYLIMKYHVIATVERFNV